MLSLQPKVVLPESSNFVALFPSKEAEDVQMNESQETQETEPSLAELPPPNDEADTAGK